MYPGVQFLHIFFHFIFYFCSDGTDLVQLFKTFNLSANISGMAAIALNPLTGEANIGGIY